MLFVAALMHAIRASARYTRAIQSTAELLGKLRVESIFVGSVARAAWLGTEVDRGAIDVLALMNAPQKSQLAMMAGHRGFRVEKDELEATVELDLVPLNFIDPEGEVRVHVLLASNALYGRMVAAGVGSAGVESAVGGRRSAGEEAAIESAVGGRRSAADETEPAVAESSRSSSTADRRPPTADSFPLRVPRAEDLALMMMLAEDQASVEKLANLPEFDRRAFDERLIAIGLGGKVIGA